MVDFALEAERHQGLGPEDSIYQACLIRFRPIMMTTIAAMFGALPLAIGMGVGSELRKPLGVAIVGALLPEAEYVVIERGQLNVLLEGVDVHVSLVKDRIMEKHGEPTDSDSGE